MILLIHPPVAKPAEPPAGLLRLAGALEAQGVAYRLLDANLEGLRWLLNCPCPATDTWTIRAARQVPRDLAYLQTEATYGNLPRYSTAVGNLNRVLAGVSAPLGVEVGLANYNDSRHSPLRSGDLRQVFTDFASHIFSPYYRERLPRLLNSFDCRYVGISLNYLNQALCAFALAGVLRDLAPRIKLIAGGGLVTSWLQSPDWQNPFNDIFDSLIPGPGEGPLLSVLGSTPPARSFFFPAPAGLPLDDYLAPGRILPYNTSLGCFWNRCTFCPEQAETNRYNPVPPAEVSSDLQRLTAEFHPRLIHLCDNALSPVVLTRLQQQPPGAPWYGFARIEAALAEPAYARRLRASGCVMLKLGLESGDGEVLAAMQKGIELELASRVLRSLTGAGIATYVYLLFGTPREDIEAARRTLAFVAAYHEGITFLNLAVFNMPLGSSLARQYGTHQFYDGDLSLYTDFHHPVGWDRLAVRRFLKQEFRSHPAVAPILRRTPPLFTSNHAALFCG